MRRIKKLLGCVFAIAIVCAGIYFVVTGEKLEEHIPDTNGPDNYALEVVTEEQIVTAGQRVSKGWQSTTSKKTLLGLGDTLTVYSCKEFSGVSVVADWDLLFDGDLFFDLYDFEVTKGNFLMCIVHDDQIVATIEPGQGTISCWLSDVEAGYYELVIAGESAAYSFAAREGELER